MMKIRNNRGLTLIELLVVLAILGIVLTGAMNFFLFSMEQYKREDAQWQMQQDARFALRQLTEEIRMSHTLEIRNEGGSDLTGSGNILTLHKYDLDSELSNEDSIEVQIKPVVDSNGNKILRRTVNGGSNTIIKNVEDILYATEDDPHGVTTLSIVLTTKLPGADNSFTVSTEVSRRIGIN